MINYNINHKASIKVTHQRALSNKLTKKIKKKSFKILTQKISEKSKKKGTDQTNIKHIFSTLNQIILIIKLNISYLNNPFKRQRLSEGIK